MLIIPYDNITDMQKFGLVTTFLSAGLILTDASFGMEKTQALGSPRCPTYGLISKKLNQQRRCKAGFFLFNATFIYTSVFSHAMLYLHSGSFRYSGYQVAVETAVVCSIKAWEGELFAFSMVLPSAYDVVLGPLTKFIYVISSHCSFVANAKYPMEMGAHIMSALLAYRYIVNSLIVYFLPPLVVEGKKSPWLTVNTGYIVFFVAIVLSMCGFGIWVNNMNEKYNKDNLWKKFTGKQYIAKMWADEIIWTDGFTSKDEERASYISTIHALYHSKETVENFIVEECVAKYVGEGKVKPDWLANNDFATAAKGAFEYWGDKEAIERVNNALVVLGFK